MGDKELKQSVKYREAHTVSGYTSETETSIQQPQLRQPEEINFNASLSKQDTLWPSDEDVIPIDTEKSLKKLRAPEPCEFNPGHTSFHPIDGLKISDVPKNFQTSDKFTLIKDTSSLAVKIEATFTSSERRKYYKDYETENMLFDKKHKPKKGTGFIVGCDKNDDTGYWEVLVETAAHVLFNQDEAVHSTALLQFAFEDKGVMKIENNVAIPLKGKDILGEPQERHDTDKSFVKFICKDEKLAKKLTDAILAVSPNPRAISCPVNSAWKVSYPHGCDDKQVSFGNVLAMLMIPGPEFSPGGSYNVGINSKYRTKGAKLEEETLDQNDMFRIPSRSNYVCGIVDWDINQGVWVRFPPKTEFTINGAAVKQFSMSKTEFFIPAINDHICNNSVTRIVHNISGCKGCSGSRINSLNTTCELFSPVHTGAAKHKMYNEQRAYHSTLNTCILPCLLEHP